MNQPLVQGPAILQAEGLQKNYGRVAALQHLDLRVQGGQIYGFLGPNGAGKTTAIRILLGLTHANGGQIKLFGQAPTIEARCNIGALVESPSAYNHLSGFDNLRILARLRNASEKQIPDLLARVGLADAAKRPVHGYSLGMRGRLSLASALLGDPELLLLDEPTNGLDPSGIREVRDLIRDLPAQGHTVMLSSHLLAEIEQTASHVGIIAEGTTRFEGSLEELQAKSSGSLCIGVDRPTEAKKLLTEQELCQNIRIDQEHLYIEDPRAQQAHMIADINFALVNAGHRVSHLSVERHTLEDLFLNLVHSETSPKPQEITA